MMLVKDVYNIPCGNFALAELPDGSLYKFNMVPSRTLTMDDLEPVDLKLPKAVYLAAAKATPFEPGLRGLTLKMYGLKDAIG